MDEVGALRQVLHGSLDDLEPPALRDRALAVVDDASLLPGALAIRTATALDASVEPTAVAQPAAGVQLSYEGLETTRDILRTNRWADEPAQAYHHDLLVAEVLVSRGLSHLATTGVAPDAIDIVRRFGRTQTAADESGQRHAEDPLEIDILELAVAAGADSVMDGVTPAVRRCGADIARELLEYPFPDPVRLCAVDDRLRMLATETQLPSPND